MPRTGLSRYKWLIILLVAVLLGWLSWLFLYQPNPVAAGESSELRSLRTALLADTTSVHGSWLRTLNPTVQNVQGDVVWNSTQQMGVMRFVDLPDPKRGMVYQLWVYDVKSDTSAPISGAVFSQGSRLGEWLLPIKTAVRVREPYKFELKLTRDAADTQGQLLLMVQP